MSGGRCRAVGEGDVPVVGRGTVLYTKITVLSLVLGYMPNSTSFRGKLGNHKGRKATIHVVLSNFLEQVRSTFRIAL